MRFSIFNRRTWKDSVKPGRDSRATKLNSHTMVSPSLLDNFSASGETHPLNPPPPEISPHPSLLLIVRSRLTRSRFRANHGMESTAQHQVVTTPRSHLTTTMLGHLPPLTIRRRYFFLSLVYTISFLHISFLLGISLYLTTQRLCNLSLGEVPSI